MRALVLVMAALGLLGCGDSCTSDADCPEGYHCGVILAHPFPPVVNHVCKKTAK